jgi:hypothetical protein
VEAAAALEAAAAKGVDSAAAVVAAAPKVEASKLGEGHAVLRCFKRFNTSYTGLPQKSASSATTSYGVDTNWYMDTGAMDHITSDLELLTVRNRYSGAEQVHAANRSGMEIAHVGHGALCSPTRQIHLKNVLHVPQSNKNLLSVHRLTNDNNFFS